MGPGAQNGLVGDAFGIDLPEVEVDQTFLIEEKKMAKFSRTAEFKRQKEYLNSRIEFYQTKLPNGAEVGLEVAPSPEDWRVANRVIGEFKAFLAQYEYAKDGVDESNDT